MAYYTYFPCPGSTGVQFTSNVAPAYPGAFIQFTSGGPELAPYLGKCYHVAAYTETAPPGTISINWATAIYDSSFAQCEDCVEQIPPTGETVYQLISCCDSTDTYLAYLPGVSEIPPFNIILVNPESSGIPAGCYDVVLYGEEASGIPIFVEDVNYALNSGCNGYPFICNSYCGACSCTRVKVKVPSGPGVTSLLYWTCNLITNEDGDVVPEIGIVEVPTDGSWSEYICAGGFIVTANQFDFEATGLCTLDIQTDQFECPKYYQLVDCDNSENTLCVSNNLYNQFINNTVIQIDGYPQTCWTVEEIEKPCQNPINAVITLSFKTCEECAQSLKTYYKLINCSNSNIVVYTETDLAIFIGSTIIVTEFPEDCWNVESSALAVTPIPVTGVVSFKSCLECNRQYYLLEDCNTEDPQPNIYTAEDLSAFVGSVITLEFCPEVCWQVSETDATTDNEVVNITGAYTSCEPCQIAVLPCQCSRIINRIEAGMRFEYYDCSGLLRLTPVLAYGQASPKVCAKLWIDVNEEDVEYFGDCVNNVCPPDEKPKKSIRPGYNTPGCTPEKYERIMCNFSESVYKQMVSIRYGIDMCCGDDDIRWEIEKELIKLKAIEDPDYTCTIGTGCDCTTSTVGLTPCIPEIVPVICHTYILTIQSIIGTSFSYNDCTGNGIIISIPGTKAPIQYTVCSQSGQTFTAPPNAITFEYVETEVVCTGS